VTDEVPMGRARCPTFSPLEQQRAAAQIRVGRAGVQGAMPIRRFAGILAAALLSACAASPPKGDDIPLRLSLPPNSEGLEIKTQRATSAEVRKELGEPREVRTLDALEYDPCKERWLYMGRLDIGMGPMEMPMHVDFDAEGRVCHHEKRDSLRERPTIPGADGER